MSTSVPLAILVAKANQKTLKRLKLLFERERVEIIKPPTSALIMVTAKDPFHVRFCVGEVLITEAQVAWKGNLGLGMIMGYEPEKALLLAFLDAVGKSTDETLKHSIHKTLASMEKTLLKREKRERAAILSTKVNFKTMAKR